MKEEIYGQYKCPKCGWTSSLTMDNMRRHHEFCKDRSEQLASPLPKETQDKIKHWIKHDLPRLKRLRRFRQLIRKKYKG